MRPLIASVFTDRNE